MPDSKTLRRVRLDKRQGKSPGAQAGEFVREEIEHVREGKHGARSAKQAIAIGLSKARRAGVKLPPPRKGATSEAMRHKAELDLEAGAARAAQRLAKAIARCRPRARARRSQRGVSRRARTARASRGA